MRLRRALHLMGTGALTGALLLGSAPTATADDIRERQWALNAFAAEDIWEHATGKGVTVAVVDTGVDAEHPDLKGSVLAGKDYTGGKGTRDDGRHGTAMAGLIAAHGHGPGGGSGMKGLAPGAKIMPLTTQIGSTGSSQAQAIRYAVDHGAKVINLSYDGPAIPGERKAVAHAVAKGAVVVAATGNSPGKHKEYPAAYPGVVSVGALGRDGTLWERSSWGSNTTLVAPGEKNVTPNKKYESGYGFTEGTSDSAAYVSAAAALVLEKHPKLSAGQVINRLIKSAKPLTDAKGNAPKLPDEKFGYGVIRPFRAVTSDISVGPKAGPLAQAGDSSASADAGSNSGSSSEEDSSGWMFALGPPIVLFGLIFVVLVGIAVVVVVFVKRKDGRDRVSDPWGSGGNGPPMPAQYQGQQVQAPSGQFGGPPNSSPPPPNQPPRR